MVRIRSELIEDGNGRLFIRYTPVLTIAGYASGEMTFPFYDAAVGSPQDEHERVKANARKNVAETIKQLAELLQCGS